MLIITIFKKIKTYAFYIVATAYDIQHNLAFILIKYHTNIIDINSKLPRKTHRELTTSEHNKYYKYSINDVVF